MNTRAFDNYDNRRASKLRARCGLGARQGRARGAAVRFLFGSENISVRPPPFSVSVGALVSGDATLNQEPTVPTSKPRI